MKLRNAHVLIGVLTCLLCSPFAGNAALNGSETPNDARGWTGRGEDAAARGDFSAQIDAWTQAARLFAAAGNDSEYRAAVARRGDAFLAAGRYQDAIRDLRQVADEEREQGHAARTAAVLSSLGNAYLFNGDPEEAGKALTESVSLARNSGDSDVEAVALNNLGNWQTDRHARRSTRAVARTARRVRPRLRRPPDFSACHSAVRAWGSLNLENSKDRD